MDKIDIVAGNDDAGDTAEAKDADAEEEGNDEVGEHALRLVDCVRIEGAKGIPAPLAASDCQS